MKILLIGILLISFLYLPGCATSNNNHNADISPFKACLNNCDESFNLSSGICGLVSLRQSDSSLAYANCVIGASKSRRGCYNRCEIRFSQ